MKKRLLLYVFMLFAFLSGKAQVGHAFYVESGGSVTLTNNIIVHNGDANLNVVTPSFNLTTDNARVFMDAETDFTLYYYSSAVDAGNNAVCTWLFDLFDSIRIRDGFIDLGAFEYVNSLNHRHFVVHQEFGGHLNLCNNVIVNNPLHTSMANVENGGTSNILSDSILVFRDPNIDFSLYASSPAVNAGTNSCNDLSEDIQKINRKCADTIDVGAFEYKVEVVLMDSVFVVYQNEEGVLTLCNNIDINNSVYAGNTNAGNVSHNIFIDNDSLFVDNFENFMPREGSAAIDAGLNDCNTVEKDLSDEERIMGENVDIGAYEQYVPSEEDSSVLWQYVVHQEETGQLLLCNNIIVNNPAHDEVTNLEVVPSNNILSDSVPVFCDELINFKIFEGSPAVDSGLNSCYTGPGVDIDKLPRIARSAIDIGAFELPIRTDTMAGGGGSGGGGGGGGAGGGGFGPGSEYYHTTVFHHDEDSLYLCNNIIINNSVFITNARPDADTVYNILVDQDSLFIDNLENFMPRDSSIAVNSGSNDCNSLELDLFTHQRIYAEIIDIGAYEQFVEESDILQFDQLLIHQLDGGQLQLCNNIIVNNFAHAAMSNIEEIPASNILSDSITLFIDPIYNFSLFMHSPAVNAGADSCCTWAVDIARNPRIERDTIDVGAFEYSAPVVYSDTTFTVLQADTSELILCNNILINNSSHSVNTNIENLPSNNIWQDNDSIFTDNWYNFLPLPQSIAVNSGSNDCQDVQVDLAQHPRVMAEIIDIGAYEQYEDEQDSIVIAAVHQVDTAHLLRLYNNIIINNPGHTHNYAGSLVDPHNLLEDTPDVFVDITSDFSLMEHSPAIDTGANEWATWRYDLKDDERISCANIVDLGAFEYSYDDVAIALTATEVLSDNCMGSYILLQATPGAQHYIWSHTNEDTCELAVLPLVSTSYTVVATNGGACRDTATIQIFPSSSLSDSSGTPSSIGKTFWLSYLRNHFREPVLTVQLSAERACSGTVSNPRTSWSVPFTVGAHSVTTVNIPLEQAYPVDANAVGDFGILVEATDTISVYAANYNNNSFDVTVVLPVNALDDEYMVQTYVPTMNSEFVIVATEDNTEVEITPSKALMGGHAARQTYVVTLQQGQTYLGISRFGGAMGDLSGSIIKARDGKRVAVFNGNVCAMVPTTNSYTDHLVEQAVGVKYWGRSFALTTTESQNFDMVRVTALRSNTVISKNGTAIATIQTGETYEFQLMGSEGSCFLETSQPAGVYLYIAGAVQGNDQELSDPSMIWIPPVEQKMNDLTFATFQSPGISNHYVNVVIPVNALDEVTLDGQLIGNEFSLMPANPQFAFVRKHILPGTHTLQCDQGFIAHVYGLGYHESYGYAAGSKAEALKEQLLVNDIPSANLPANQRFCPYEPIDFRVEVNYSCDSVLWNFGDSSNIVNAMSTTHAFTEAGSYAVSATLFLTSGEAVFCTNMYVRVNVVEGFGAIYYDTICYGERYQLHGFDVEADEAGHFTHTRTVEMPGMYCDSTYILELEVLNNVVRIEDTICEQNLYDHYGFTFLATDVGWMTDTLHLGTSLSGCDSMKILNLLITPNMEHIPEIIGEAYPCVGEVFAYSLDSLSSLQDVSWLVSDSVAIVAQPDDYHISLLFESSDESYEISVQGHNRCGDTILRKMIYPQPYSYVQLVDTICDNHRHYQHYGFDIEYVPDSSDVYVHHDVSSAGCDSTTVVAIVIVPTYHVTDTVVVCETDLPYLYQDSWLAAEGTYTLTLSSQCGCDSVVDLTVLVNPSTYAIIDDTVHYYDLPYELNGSFYDTSGVYTQTLQHANIYGCDSLLTLHLTVLYNIMVQADSVICQSELPLVWNSITFTLDENPGVPVILADTAILPLPSGVDSIVVMQVTVNPTTYGTLDTAVFENDLPLVVHGESYSVAGTYLQTLQNTNIYACDSVLTLHLNVGVYRDSVLCQTDLPLVWNGVAFDLNGMDTLADMMMLTDSAILTTSTGADSMVVMRVHVLPTTYASLDTVVLENELPLQLNGENYSVPDSYIQTLTNFNAEGCDSVLMVNMTVLYNVSVEDDSTVCETELPLIWNGVMFIADTLQDNYYILTDSARLTASNGVDSIVVMTVMVNPTTYGTLDTTVLENDLPLSLHGFSYMTDSVFTQTLSAVNANGCDSVLTVNLTVLRNVVTTLYDTICESQLPIVWNGVPFDTAGTQDTVLTASTGVDSTLVMTVIVNPTTYGTLDTIVLENNLPLWLNGLPYSSDSTFMQTLAGANANGCDSVLTVNLTVHYNNAFYLDTTICEGDFPLTWNGAVFAIAGTQSVVNQGSNGADSTVVMTVNEYPVTYGTLDTAVLENNLPLWLNGLSYSTDSTFTQTLARVDANGCDSVLTVNLTVLYNVMTTLYDTICESQLPITWNGVQFDTAGTQDTVLTASSGVDSTVVMTVTVNPTTYGTLDTTVLENELPFLLHGFSYLTDSVFTQTLPAVNANGCDSVLTVNLTVLRNVVTTLYDTICESQLPIVWNGVPFDTAGTQDTVLTASTGVDSTVVMTLHLFPTTYGTLDTAVLENDLPLLLNGESYGAADTYTQNLVAANSYGCDSILTINLTVIPNVTVEVDSTICDDEFPFTWNDSVFTVAGTKTTVLPAYTGADSIVVMTVNYNPTTYGTLDTAVLQDSLPLLINGQSYSIPAVYTQYLTNAAGCDSVLTINMTEIYNVVAIVDSVVCAFNTPFVWNGVTFTQTTVEVAHLTASTGADSMLVMRVKVVYTTYGTLDTTVLENDLPFVWNEDSINTPGYHIQSLQNYAGCDSILTIHLRILYNERVVEDSVLCETELPLEWNGVVFDVADIESLDNTLLLVDSITTQASTGADSTVVMMVHVNPTTYGILDTTVLENDLPLWLNGLPYSSDSTFTQTFVGANANGCDSILTVNLTVLNNVITSLYDTICENQLPITWNGVIFEDAGTQDTLLTASTGVDSTVVMTLYVNPISYGSLDTIVLENDLPLILNGSSYMTDSVFTQTLSSVNINGCDSILTVNLTVLNNVITSLYDTICENQLPITWNGVVFDDGSTQDTVLTASSGVDSTVVMTLYVNPITYGSLDTIVLENDLPLILNGSSYMTDSVFTQTLSSININGCDSILTVNLTVLNNVITSLYDTICENQLPITWNGIIFDDGGTQDTVLTASTGVDSTVVMTLYVNPITYGTLDTTVLENELPLSLNGSDYWVDSSFTQTLSSININGCDSILTVNLTVLNNVITSLYDTICENQLPITWNGVIFEDAGTQDTVLTASTGVDSTVVMTLYVNPISYGSLDTIVLENDLPLILNGSSYMTDSVFTQTLSSININGCDSVLTVSMTVLYNVTTTLYDTICENQLPITWNGVVFDDGSTQDTVLTASSGVDSTVVMTLYVNPITYGSLDTIVLENDLPLSLNGFSYMTDSVFTQTLPAANVNGCDSVLTVNMTVLYNLTVEVDSVICDGELPFTWNGVTFAAEDIDSVTVSATDSVLLTAFTGVDSTVVMTVHVHYANMGVDEQTACDSYTWIDGVTYTASTDSASYTLTNAAGCDSVVTLHLTVNHSVVSQDTLVLVENQLPYHITAADTTISNGAPSEFQFNYHLSTVHGCDSTIEQTVIIHYNTSETLDTTVCAASLPYNWHGHQFTQAGSYSYIILNADGSDHVITCQLMVSNPTVTIQNITHINCYGASTGGVGVLVSGGVQPYNCHWENNAGATVSTTAQLSNQSAGTYVLHVVDAIGCAVMNTVTLQHQNDSMVAGVIASDHLVCYESVVGGFTGTAASGGASSAYQWQISTNGTDWTAAPTPNNAQNYTYPNTVTSSFSLRRAWISQACGTVYSNVVTVSVAPVYDDTLRENVCQGYAYQEYGFDITAEETAEPTVITRVRNLQSVNSCDSTVTLVLTVIPSTHTTVTDESCQRAPYQANGFDLAAEELGTVGVHTFERVYTTSGCDSIVNLQLTIHPVYEIDFEDVVCEGSAYNLHGFDVTTVQTLGVSDVDMTQHLQSQNGCDSIVNLYLRVVDTSIAIVSLTSDFCEEYSAELSVETNMMDYLWNTGETSQTITVTRPGTYTVTATQDNCSVTSWYTIETCELNIYLPNAITPGLGDGLNDYFCLHEKYLPMIEDFEIRIYTRWGELIYYSDDKNFKWNGEYKGRINRQIIYTYLINFTDNRGIPHQLTGSITVL